MLRLCPSARKYLAAIVSSGPSPAISIRGATTLSGSRNMLLVVDGFIFNGPLSDINPNGNESVGVLKDPSSMAIYGAQALAWANPC